MHSVAELQREAVGPIDFISLPPFPPVAPHSLNFLHAATEEGSEGMQTISRAAKKRKSKKKNLLILLELGSKEIIRRGA